jgi:hypothetical protein
VARRCAIEGCQDEHCARGWCCKHYARVRRHGDPQAVRSPRYCVIPGCTGRHLARGWCVKHYERWRRYRDPLFIKKPWPKKTVADRAG